MSPTDNRNEVNIPSSNQPHHSPNASPSLYFNRFRPVVATAGYIFSDISGPIMAAGCVHGCGRNLSENYLKTVKRYPSGAMIFLTGLALNTISDSLIETYGPREKPSMWYGVRIN